jgi:hypothetical protein
MNWNYRVVRTSTGLHVFDVYYDDQDKPIAMHTAPSTVHGETVAELRDKLDLIVEALTLPILEQSAIGSNGATR